MLVTGVSSEIAAGLRSVLDFGCGYGALLWRIQEHWSETLDSAIGVDFSQTAIDVANSRFQRSGLRYQKLPEFDIADNTEFLRALLPNGVDAIFLVDLLEHVADCKTLISTLSEFTRLFIIKLPIESNLLSNYILPKEYPSSVHSNGHLREFTVNNVHYFVRSLGLTPIYEGVYLYDAVDAFPPLPPNATTKQKFLRIGLRAFKSVLSRLLTKKVFLRLAGDGGYFCVASYNSDHILNP